MIEKISDTGIEEKSQKLKGRHLLFGVCGSIGAVDAVRQIRELRRHGAEVTTLITEEGGRFITPLSLEWASQKPVLSALGPLSEHLGDYSGMVICPATWNSLVGLSLGRASNSLLTAGAIQIARKNPVLIVPTLNEEFTHHPLYGETMSRLESFPGVRILLGSIDESRHKMPSPEILAEKVIAQFNLFSN